MLKDIESAKSPENAITIISEKECDDARVELRRIFNEVFPSQQEISVIPILRSGLRLGQELTEPLGIELNPMRMSYYNDDTSRLPKPICLIHPNITQIISLDGTTKKVIFTECVVDSQETILAAMEEINTTIDALGVQTNQKLAYPEYSVFAYVSKIGDGAIRIPNLVAAFSVHPDIWVGGLGCDLPGDLARDLPYLVGILSPFSTNIPKKPYYISILG